MTDAIVPEKQEAMTARSRVYVSEKGPPHFSDDLRFEVAIQRPGSDEWDHLTYGTLKKRPLNIEDDQWIRSEADRKVLALKKDRKEEPNVTIRALRDIPEIAGSGCGALKKDETTTLPSRYAHPLLMGGAADEVLKEEEKRSSNLAESSKNDVPAIPIRFAILVTRRDRRGNVLFTYRCMGEEKNTSWNLVKKHCKAGDRGFEPEWYPMFEAAMKEAVNGSEDKRESLGLEKDLATAEEPEGLKMQREDDEELLRNGAWWDVVNKAIDEFLAGETSLCKMLVYSGLSHGLKEMRLHMMSIGDPQIGKSYEMRSIGAKLFLSIFIDLASLNAKALYYAAGEANDPRLFDGKILFVDEVADQGDGTLAMLKSLMSNGVSKLTSMTVDDHKKSKVQTLEGLPIVWSTSAEVLEDAEGQFMVRPFIINPDESDEQTERIRQFQRDAVTAGLLRESSSSIPHARRLLERILEEKDFEVYNLFADYVRIGDTQARNTLPQFFSLVAAITYAHRFARIGITLPDGRKIFFASYQDNKEAADLWQWSSGPKSVGLPERHIELLRILPEYTGLGDGKGLDLDSIREKYSEKTGRKVSHKTVLNYLSTLSSKDKATYYEDGDGNHLWYSTGPPNVPTSSQLLIGMDSEEGIELLDKQLDALDDALSQLPNEMRLSIEELKERIIGKAA